MRILLTGATGFVGRHVHPALSAAGHEVRCGSRRPKEAKRHLPSHQWVHLDVRDPSSIREAMTDCDAAIYLVHNMHTGPNYPDVEAQCAIGFAEAAQSSKVQRLVYLGGVLPTGGAMSKHLESRRRTGALLRSTNVPTTELRAAMIIGAGSASWVMVRDLAARLPAMLLPRWLKNLSHPVAIDDVVYAIMCALVEKQPEEPSHHIYEIPGPEGMTHRELLQRVAHVLGHERLMMNVPVLSPRLSSYWIALVTRVDLNMAQELVEGVRYDLIPTEPILWDMHDHTPMSLEEAAKLALSDEAMTGVHPPPLEARSRQIGSRFRTPKGWSNAPALNP